MRDINKKFSVRYYLNLVLVDEEERRYFKQQVSKLALLENSDDNFAVVVDYCTTVFRSEHLVQMPFAKFCVR